MRLSVEPRAPLKAASHSGRRPGQAPRSGASAASTSRRATPSRLPTCKALVSGFAKGSHDFGQSYGVESGAEASCRCLPALPLASLEPPAQFRV